MLDRVTKKRAAAREAKRRWRGRQDAGGAVLLVPLKDINGVIKLLLTINRLDMAASEDRKAIAAGLRCNGR
jgi:hypothetical protein